MNADITTLYQNDFCEIKNFLCKCTDRTLSKPEYQSRFSICYVRRSNFLFNVFRNELDAYSGLFLLNKPGFEHRVGHDHATPDQCTIFTFNRKFYEELSDRNQNLFNGFFRNRDIHSMLVKPGMGAEYLHNRIFNLVQQKKVTSLQVDGLILDLVDRLFNENRKWDHIPDLTSSLKKHHLTTIEDAKHYLKIHFSKNISLGDVASSCFMSKFHFARTFRKVTGITPHQYLLQFRLQHAKQLLESREIAVSDAAFASGFSDSNYFSATFKKHFKVPPSTLLRP